MDLKCRFSGWCKCCFLSFQHLVNLFARLANDNIGYIDWDPYIPKVRGFIVMFFAQCLGPWTWLHGWILSLSFEDFTFDLTLEIWACGVCFIVRLRNKISAFLVNVSKDKSLVYVSDWLLEPCYLKIQSCATGKSKQVSLSKSINNMLQWQSSKYLHPNVCFFSHALNTLSDFYQDPEEFEPPRRHQSDDGAPIHHQCLRHQPRGPLGVFPPGLCAFRHLCMCSLRDAIKTTSSVIPREDPASRRKPNSVASSVASHPFSTHQTTAAGWWVTSDMPVLINLSNQTCILTV